ncbi:MAG: hypothetical protein ACK456_15545 [Pseudanabaenaceae cyanobacterium]|jgi:hypothetical protein
MVINWQNFAQIGELATYFSNDSQGFQAQIQQHLEGLQKIEPVELDRLAILRVLEVTNGCTQWGFRRQDPEALSVEQTRECMRQVIGFIRARKIDLPNGTSITFSDAIEELITEGTKLYQDAFKNNIPEAEQEYYAYSTAQFIVYGCQRLENALQLIKQEFEPLFGSYYIGRGERYIRRYITAMSN